MKDKTYFTKMFRELCVQLDKNIITKDKYFTLFFELIDEAKTYDLIFEPKDYMAEWLVEEEVSEEEEEYQEYFEMSPWLW